ncbi:MAG: VWA domain-containing protein [Anaerolineales bacterium]|nr:VWA domain-containing protein [Anaerolineales bacterium]
MVDARDYYMELEISRDATQDDIRRAYHLAVRKYHPDVNKDTGNLEVFLRIQNAYDVLSDPVRKSAYDADLPPAPDQSDLLKIASYSSRSTIPRLTEPQLLYILFELSKPQDVTPVTTPPLNVCLVLDRSTSMQGQRLDTVKNASIELLHQLNQEDILSIVTFSDRAEVLFTGVPQNSLSQVETQIQRIRTSGGTEIYQGLASGITELRRNIDNNHINQLLLLTDGRTYGDEQPSLELAEEAAKDGICISCLGLGNNWNDVFLDGLAMRTGGDCQYLAHPQEIKNAFYNIFSKLTAIYAKQINFNFSLQNNVEIAEVYRLSPEPGRLPHISPIPAGALLNKTNLNIIFELKINPFGKETKSLTVLHGELLFEITSQVNSKSRVAIHIDLPVSNTCIPEYPPLAIINALSNLTLYRLQEKAKQDLANGDIATATQRLTHLANHLKNQGQMDLANTISREAESIQKTHKFSQEGKMKIKYGTRALLPSRILTNP